MSGVLDRTEQRRRNFLFLQGPLSPLFKVIGEKLRARGFGVYRINLCAGDWLHWHGAGCSSYRGRPTDWPDFIADYLERFEITDLVLHGDQRLYHRKAIAQAKRRGVYIAVTELGMLRKGWMTLERNGLSTLSHFPDDPDTIRHIAEQAGGIDLSPKYPSSFWLQTAPDVVYNMTNVLFHALYRHYQRHTIYPPVTEYLRGAVRLMSERRRAETAERTIKQLVEQRIRYFVFPLQLEGDFQLRRHSPYASFADVIDLVLTSFAKNAPNEMHLVIKSHPLDVGFEGWPRKVSEIAQCAGVQDRVHFLDGGGLGLPFESAAGVITLNSTAGLEGLQEGLPVKALVPAHYDIRGLTHQAALETFWSQPEPPDLDLLNAYLRALALAIQVRGSIHNREGVHAAAENIATKLMDRSLNAHGGFTDPPPRLDRARKLGVPL